MLNYVLDYVTIIMYIRVGYLYMHMNILWSYVRRTWV